MARDPVWHASQRGSGSWNQRVSGTDLLLLLDELQAAVRPKPSALYRTENSATLIRTARPSCSGLGVWVQSPGWYGVVVNRHMNPRNRTSLAVPRSSPQKERLMKSHHGRALSRRARQPASRADGSRLWDDS